LRQTASTPSSTVAQRRRRASNLAERPAPAAPALATLAATGDLHIPIAATHPLTAVRDAYQALADRKVHGRIVLHPQDLV
jgi:D-arabinose 1-dehydrogenase-like Zn-dependent alcohol dehydrogenase